MSSLILTPEFSNYIVINLLDVLAYLRHSRFIGMPLEKEVTTRLCSNAAISELDSNSFLVGEAFLQLITFMGCSPNIELTPPSCGGPFCYIRIEGPWIEPRLLYGDKTQAPRCSTCRNRIITWRESLPLWLAQPQNLVAECQRCGHTQRPLDLSWRKDAGFGRLFVIVENVFPGEAIPVPKFLLELERTTGTFWKYFYAQN